MCWAYFWFYVQELLLAVLMAWLCDYVMPGFKLIWIHSRNFKPYSIPWDTWLFKESHLATFLTINSLLILINFLFLVYNIIDNDVLWTQYQHHHLLQCPFSDFLHSCPQLSYMDLFHYYAVFGILWLYCWVSLRNMAGRAIAQW